MIPSLRYSAPGSAVALASVTVTWRTVSLSFPPRWLVYRRPNLKRYLVPMIAMVVAAGLAGCAGQSEQRVQFFKAYGFGQVEPRHLGMNIIAVSQTEQEPPASSISRKDK